MAANHKNTGSKLTFGDNFSTIYESMYGKLHSFIRNRIDKEEEAEDIVQNVFMSLAKADTANPVEQVSSWLFSVARNQIIDWRRKKRKKKCRL